MTKRGLIFILCLIMLLPVIATAENTVVILPTTPPLPDLVVEENPYAFEDLTAYYEGEYEYQTPALTASERERLADAQHRWDAGGRPDVSILNLTENVHVALIQVPAEQYEGESWFLLLPARELTDDELLQVVDAYEQLGITLSADMITWHNTLRGGGIEIALRSKSDDERARYNAISEQFIRSGLRPETPFTDSVTDDGLGRVTLDEEDYCGAPYYTFYPARRMTDVFDRLPFMLGKETPPIAEELMQSNLYQDTVNNVEITVREAGYDGRTLLVEYSYRMLDVDKVYGVTAAEEFGENLPDGMEPDTILEQLSDEAFDALAAHNVGWNFDQLWINGQGVNMPNNSGAVYSGSKVPGEIIYTEYWRLDNESVFLHDGVNQITLPIGASVDAETRKSLADQETKMYRMPESGVVTFNYEVKDIASQVKSFSLNEEKVLPNVTAKVTDATFTPLMTYITLDLKVNPDSLAAFIAANGEGSKNEDGEVMWPYGGIDVFGEWVESLELVDVKGQQVFPGHYGQNGMGNEWAEFLYPHLDNIPDELFLAPIENGQADMTQAVRVK